MTYAIMTVIYGVPLNEAVSDTIEQWEESDDDRWTDGDDGPCGFTKLYSSGGERLVGYCGVELCEFDETNDAVLVSELKLTPTKKQKVLAKERVKKLDPQLRKAAGRIDVYIICSSS